MLEVAFEGNEGQVGQIGPCPQDLQAALGVEAPDEVRVSLEALPGCDPFKVISVPDSALVSERGEARFGPRCQPRSPPPQRRPLVWKGVSFRSWFLQELRIRLWTRGLALAPAAYKTRGALWPSATKTVALNAGVTPGRAGGLPAHAGSGLVAIRVSAPTGLQVRAAPALPLNASVRGGCPAGRAGPALAGPCGAVVGEVLVACDIRGAHAGPADTDRVRLGADLCRPLALPRGAGIGQGAWVIVIALCAVGPG